MYDIRTMKLEIWNYAWKGDIHNSIRN